MDRSGWLAWAWTASLMGAVVAANGFVVSSEMAEVLQDESRDQPPEAPWFAGIAWWIGAGAAALVAAAAGAASYGWARSRARARRPAPLRAAQDTVADDRIVAPPGFGGPAVKTKRAGAGALAAWSVAGLLVLAGGAALAVLALLTMEQTRAMEGRGFRQAVLWGQILRFAALPLLAIGAAALAWGWGRWFPLGAVEVVAAKGADAPQRPLHLKWQRHD